MSNPQDEREALTDEIKEAFVAQFGDDRETYLGRDGSWYIEGFKAARQKYRAALANQRAEQPQQAEFCYLVELFLGDGTGNSLGWYHTGFTDLGGNSRSTQDPLRARRYPTWREANLVAVKLGHTLQGTWRAVQHGFATTPPSPSIAQPEAVPQWIDDPHDIEQGRMLNPEWLKLHGLTAAQVANQRAEAGPDIPKELDVRTILLGVVPGWDGMGEEVFAKSVADVEKKLSAMGEELEDWQLGIRRYQPEAVPQGGQWASWVATMVGGYLDLEVDDPKIAAIAGIIQRRMPSPQPPAAQAWVPLKESMRAELVNDLRYVFEPDAPETPRIVHDVIEYADSWLSVYIQKSLEAHGIGTAKPAQPEDENEVLRQKVKTLASEAWAWSKACEAESMKLTAVRKAIADAFLPMSRSGLWTKEHSQSYPSKAAEIINAARSIFDVEASQPAQPEAGITAPAGGGEG